MFGRYRHLLAYTVPLSAWVAFLGHGAWTVLPLVLYFVVLPATELLLAPDARNLDDTAREAVAASRFHDVALYATVPLQLATLLLFLVQVDEPGLSAFETAGRIAAMGILCGVLGINAGHELGHRPSPLARRLGDVLLLTALENHFTPYHNRGHHRHVATPADPATARRGETLYAFWRRSRLGSYRLAWALEAERLARLGRPWHDAGNVMIRYTLLQLVLLGAILTAFGPAVLAAFLLATAIGMLMLETVNYIEHYGLLRERLPNGRYERVRHAHSWNSDHVLGRSLLFELSRHSDHHYRAAKPYQLLDSLPDSPQMPTGYPGMMLLALVPPLWRRVVHARLDRIASARRPDGPPADGAVTAGP